jgi:hypothetical protein
MRRCKRFEYKIKLNDMLHCVYKEFRKKRKIDVFAQTATAHALISAPRSPIRSNRSTKLISALHRKHGYW